MSINQGRYETVICLIQGEQKIVTFLFKDIDGELIDLTNVTFSFTMIDEDTDNILLTKSDSDFDKSEVTSGKAKVQLSTTDLSTVGHYLCEMKATFPTNEIDKSEIFKIIINESLTS